MPGFVNYYEVLGLARTCSKEDIRKRYLALTRRLHPDSKRSLIESLPETVKNKKFSALVTAYETLYDSSKRKIYDNRLSSLLDSDCFFGNTVYKNGRPTAGATARGTKRKLVTTKTRDTKLTSAKTTKDEYVVGGKCPEIKLKTTIGMFLTIRSGNVVLKCTTYHPLGMKNKLLENAENIEEEVFEVDSSIKLGGKATEASGGVKKPFVVQNCKYVEACSKIKLYVDSETVFPLEVLFSGRGSSLIRQQNKRYKERGDVIVTVLLDKSKMFSEGTHWIEPLTELENIELWKKTTVEFLPGRIEPVSEKNSLWKELKEEMQQLYINIRQKKGVYCISNVQAKKMMDTFCYPYKLERCEWQPSITCSYYMFSCGSSSHLAMDFTLPLKLLTKEQPLCGCVHTLDGNILCFNFTFEEIKSIFNGRSRVLSCGHASPHLITHIVDPCYDNVYPLDCPAPVGELSYKRRQLFVFFNIKI